MTNIWLAILAMVSLIELAGLVGLVVLAIPVFQRIDALVGSLEREIAPMVTRAHEVMDQMDDVAARVRRLDDDARFAAERVRRGVVSAAGFAQAPLRVLRGLSALFQAFRGPVRRGNVVNIRDEQDAEARFVYEGGQQPRAL